MKIMNAPGRCFAVLAMLPCAPLAQPQQPPSVLPAAASTRLVQSLAAAAPHSAHVWRDSPPTNSDGTVNGYIEISRGDRRKWEFDMGRNARAIDRMIPKQIGGYPVNYGFVPQTMSYDGDPFDVLVLGPAVRGGDLVRGTSVGLMHMEDEKGLDSKVVLSPIGRDGRPRYELTPQIRDEIAKYFRTYKQGEPGKFSKVPGWRISGRRSQLRHDNARVLQELSTAYGHTVSVDRLIVPTPSGSGSSPSSHPIEGGE
jgi:inorganic pyrophosphatase